MSIHCFSGCILFVNDAGVLEVVKLAFDIIAIVSPEHCGESFSFLFFSCSFEINNMH